MAENETLDLWNRHNGRWRRLFHKIQNGAPPEDFANEANRCLYKTFRNLIDLFNKQGLPLSEMLAAAARSDDSLHKMVGRCREGRDYAQRLEQLPKGNGNTRQLIEKLLKCTVDCFLDQIGHKLLGQSAWPTAVRFRILTNDIHTAMRPSVVQLAGQLSERPDLKPRMPARSAEQKSKDHVEIMHTSLLPHRSGTHG